MFLLGFCFLVVWAFYQSREKLASTFLLIQTHWLPPSGMAFRPFFFRALGLALLSGSPQRVRLTGMAMLQSGKWSLRWALLFLCFSSLGVIVWVGMLSLAFQLAGGYLLLFGAFGALCKKRLPSLAAFFWFLFFLGLFLFATESAVRMSTFLVQEESYQDFIFLLSDNRLPAVLLWLLCSALVTFMFEVEAWSWIFSVLGLSAGIMGINVAVALIVGESLGWALLFLRLHWRLDAAYRKLAIQYFLVNLIAALVFFIAYGWSRSEFIFISSASGSPLQERIILLLGWGLIWSAGLTAVSMVWGHFQSSSRALRAEPGRLSSDTASAGLKVWLEKGWILPTFVQSSFSLSQMGKDQRK
jgi:hypothetical protein